MDLPSKICIAYQGPLGLTRGFVELGERGRAMHAGKDLCAQSSLVTAVNAPDTLVKNECLIRF